MRIPRTNRLPLAAVGTLAAFLAGLAASPADAADKGIEIGWAAADLASVADVAPPANLNVGAMAPDTAAQTQLLDDNTTPRFGGLAADPLLSPFEAFGPAKTTTFESFAPDLHFQLTEVGSSLDQPGLPLVSDPAELQLNPAAQADSAHTMIASADWQFAPGAGLGIAASGSRFTLGSPLRFDLPDTATLLGISAFVNFGDGWVTSVTFDEGRADLDLRPTALSLGSEEKFGVSLARNDIFGSDTLGVSLIRPIQPSDSVLLAPQISFSSATPETDLQLNYETTFDSNITLEANAGYQTNVAGQAGTKAISVLSRAKINF